MSSPSSGIASSKSVSGECVKEEVGGGCVCVRTLAIVPSSRCAMCCSTYIPLSANSVALSTARDPLRSISS